MCVQCGCLVRLGSKFTVHRFPVSLLVQVPGRFSLYIKYISGDDVPCPTSPIQLWLALPILILALSFNFIIMFRTGWLFLAQINGLSCQLLLPRLPSPPSSGSESPFPE